MGKKSVYHCFITVYSRNLQVQCKTLVMVMAVAFMHLSELFYTLTYDEE